MAATFSEPINSNDQSLERVLAAGLPVALVFQDGANGLDETLSRLARDNAGQLLVVKVKAADNPQSVRRFLARGGSLPAVVTLKGGQTVSQAAPATASELEQHVAFLLGKGPRPAPGPTPRPAATQATSSGHAGPVVVTEASRGEQVL